MNVADRRLIEEAFPLRQISEQAKAEQGIRRGHIDSLHIWWARRPLVACRAAILGSLLRDPADERERKKLLGFLLEYCTWKASNELKLVEEARRLVLSANGNSSPALLDCFAGGGAIPLEALRAGCRTFAFELNPVAALIERCTIVYPQKYGTSSKISSKQKNLKGENVTEVNRLAHDIEKWGNWVFERAKQELEKFHVSMGDKRRPIAYLWARTVRCRNPSCGAEIPLIRKLSIVDKPKRKIALKLVGDKKSKQVRIEIAHGRKVDFDTARGTMMYGTVECPVCKLSFKSSYLREEAMAARMGERMIAVIEPGPTGTRSSYRVPEDADFNGFAEAARYLGKKLQSLKTTTTPLPEEPIPTPIAEGTEKGTPFFVHLQVVNYGIRNWGQLFNSRQALALLTFSGLVRKAYDEVLTETDDVEYAKAVTLYLALTMDSMAHYLSNSSTWLSEGMISVFIQGQAIPFRWDYGESNPLGERVGTWRYALNQTTEVVRKICEIPMEPGTVYCSSSTRLPFANESIDAVVTDPPYYDAIPYSDLSDFFYVWLKRAIGDLFPEFFSTPLTPKSPEIIQNTSLMRRVKSIDAAKSPVVKDKSYFENEMTKVLKEVHRVLRPSGICAVLYAHKAIVAWESLIKAIINSGFKVTASWPLHTERTTRLRAHESAVLASSVWLICRKRDPEEGVGSWKKVQTELDRKVKERLDFFIKEGMKGADALVSAIGPALEVFGQYERVEKVTGEPVEISDFLDKVHEVVAQHALSTVLAEQELGNVDAPTAFYVLWKWTFEPAVQNGRLANSETKAKGNGNHILVPFDDALKIARSVGADPEILLKMRILKQEKEYVRLLGPNERKHVSGLGDTARDGTASTTIDMIHRAVNLWAAMDHAQLEEYLEKSGAKRNETFWRVANALSKLLPLESKEKQLLDGLSGRHAEGLEERRPRDVRSLDEFVKKEEK
jgi:adenine-specific DNA methylase